MKKIILVASGKGGVGKSTLCSNIAACLSENGKKVLLIDGDLRLRNLDIYLGLSESVIFDIQDVCLGHCSFDKAVINHPDFRGIDFIAAPGKTITRITDLYGFIAGLAKEKSDDYDFVFIDCPAGSDENMFALFGTDSFLLLVANPDKASVRDASAIAAAAYLHNIDSRLVVNRIRPDLMKKNLVPDVDDVIDGASVQLIGIVPEDIRITVNAQNGVLLPSLRKARSHTAINNISKRLCGEDVPLYIFK